MVYKFVQAQVGGAVQTLHYLHLVLSIWGRIEEGGLVGKGLKLELLCVGFRPKL